MRGALRIMLTEEECKKLTQLARSRTASVRLVCRAQIIPRAAGGKSHEMIAAAVGVGRAQAGRWRARHAEGGLAAIAKDRPRGGRPARADSAYIVYLTIQTKPERATQWSTRSLAAKAGGRQHDAADLASAWPETPPREDLRGLAGPGIRRRARRHRGALPEPPGPCSGALL